MPPFLNMVGCVLTGGALLAFGTPEQQAEHLAPIITGERVWCQLFSEPDAGSDLASLQTRAERDGDRWVVTGQKVWCSNGRVADRGILLARTDPDAAPHRGISFFLLDMHAPGVETRPLRQMNGGAEFDEVFLAEVDAARRRAARSGARGLDGRDVGAHQRARLHRRRRASACNAGSTRCSRWATSSTPVGRQELTALWSRGTTLWAMGQRQGPVASVLSSIAKLGTTELLFDTANFRTETAGADAMLAGPGERRPAVGARRAHRGRHQSDPAQHHRRAHPRPPEGAEVAP